MTSMIQPMCMVCTRRGANLTCAAYPDGIPVAILESDVDHRRPHPGDGGVVFEPIDNPQLVADVLADLDDFAFA